MNIKEIIIFFLVFFSVYFFGNLYIYKRSVLALALEGRYLNYYRVLFLFILLSYPVAKIGTSFFGNFFLSKQLNIIGSVFMGVMLYSLLTIFFVDILRAANHFVHFFPDIITKNKILAGRITFCTVFFIIFCTTAYGLFNAKHLKVIEQEIFFDKLKAEHSGFTIVQISDIHLGDIINEKFLSKVVEKVNSLEPDLIAITGDLIDDGATDLNKLNPLANLKSKFGTFFVSGNHDHFIRIRPDTTENKSPITSDSANSDTTRQRGFSNSPLGMKLEELQVKILHSQYVMIDSAFTLFGIENSWGRRGSGRAIKPVSELIEGYNKESPLIMLKHVPNGLEYIAGAGVDLLLAGHTHHGQMFPLNFITDEVYEVSHGHGKYENLQIYVNCGTGFWGPPIKVGVPAEITKIILKNK